MAENPFAPPSEEGTSSNAGIVTSDRVLAPPWTRFLARFGDQVVMVLAAIPGGMIGLSTESLLGDPDLALVVALGLGALGVLVVVGYNWMLIATEGRTIAKRALGIRIVTTDGEPPGFVRGVVLREWVVTGVDTVLSLLTGFGVLGLVDSVMVFSEGNRTLHDRLANTQVVQDDVKFGPDGEAQQGDWLDAL